MAATMTKRANAAAQKSAAPARSRSVRVCCAKQGDSVLARVQTVAATVAAAALLQASPVCAKVVLEQPQLKKVFQDDAPAAAVVKREIILPGQRSKQAAAPAAKAAPAKKAEAVSSGEDIDPRTVALPGALVLIAGGAFALSKVDEDFEAFITKASLKDSATTGAGYEVAIKGGNGVVAAGRKAAPAKVGTKKVKAAKSTASASPLSSLFGSKDD